MESKIIELDNMKKADLKKLSKSQVTKMLSKQNVKPERAVPKPRIRTIPTPSVNRWCQNMKIISSLKLEFRDG